uniref:Uncharacterized protein n=1 Tax=Arundo donax TaxID=35708 RepID=A0A0A9HQW2_ARUDO
MTPMSQTTKAARRQGGVTGFPAALTITAAVNSISRNADMRSGPRRTASAGACSAGARPRGALAALPPA